MKLSDVVPMIKGIPHMTEKQGETIYKLILDNKIKDVLELGIAHGVGSCYMAAALDEKGGGSIVTIDNKSALERKPNVHELTEKCGLTKYVTPVFANSSYNWELMKLIDRQTKNGVCEPLFDFCYLDGAHNFEIDCCAFFLVDRLMKPGGIILFDDLNWTYGKSPSLKDTEWVKKMDDDEKHTPHIKKLVDLIVSNHPHYHQASTSGEWFLARKKGGGDEPGINLSDYTPKTTLMERVKRVAQKVKNKVG